jgi:hypothetical protein
VAIYAVKMMGALAPTDALPAVTRSNFRNHLAGWLARLHKAGCKLRASTGQGPGSTPG